MNVTFSKQPIKDETHAHIKHTRTAQEKSTNIAEMKIKHKISVNTIITVIIIVSSERREPFSSTFCPSPVDDARATR